MKLTMPCVLDNMENTTEKAYGGWPDRICIVDIAGKVAFYSAPGPAGFKPQEAETALEAVLANNGKMVRK
jgi:type I thyroxine 5'-deiodinase